MKQVLLFLAMLVPATEFSDAAKEGDQLRKLASISSTGLGGKVVRFEWTVPLETLRKTSTWANQEKAPALTMLKAIEAARKYLQDNKRPHNLRVRNVELRAPIDSNEKESYYIYAIDFFEPEGRNIQGYMIPEPQWTYVVVLLDGNVVTPNEIKP
jgi:hypothetical protein